MPPFFESIFNLFSNIFFFLSTTCLKAWSFILSIPGSITSSLASVFTQHPLQLLPTFHSHPFDTFGELYPSYIGELEAAEEQDFKEGVTVYRNNVIKRLRKGRVSYTLAPSLSYCNFFIIDRKSDFININRPTRLHLNIPSLERRRRYPVKAGKAIPHVWIDDHHHLIYLGTIDFTDDLQPECPVILAIEVNMFGYMDFRIVSVAPCYKYYFIPSTIKWEKGTYDIRWHFPIWRLHLFFNNRLIVPIREFFLRQGVSVYEWIIEETTSAWHIYSRRAGKRLLALWDAFLSVFPPPENVPDGVLPYGHVY
ncbi:hypothetical protein SISNIDRAFT_526665 [Sistotremastrum niveocremeum HHB9708]|uniref:Uncharacterized protein n=1 Tax=Sistotremastrum niveocremeum HHB9708 TaxID=1314777 RepID=A0A164QJD1_9AGAM|nr:hypothetical protein SISNIDRAFT_526665 [Sistotremastrum niveocremeum HHB9708]